jgi:hypothetical protein
VTAESVVGSGQLVVALRVVVELLERVIAMGLEILLEDPGWSIPFRSRYRIVRRWEAVCVHFDKLTSGFCSHENLDD